jgi:hypothetical protein
MSYELVIAAKEAGAADSDIAAKFRHSSLAMIKRYGERPRAPHRQGDPPAG